MKLLLFLIPRWFTTSYIIWWIGYRLAYDRLLPSCKGTMPVQTMNNPPSPPLSQSLVGWHTIFRPIVLITFLQNPPGFSPYLFAKIEVSWGTLRNAKWRCLTPPSCGPKSLKINLPLEKHQWNMVDATSTRGLHSKGHNSLAKDIRK